MRERYRFLIRSGLDLSAALMIQFTLLGATIAIFALDTLRNLAFFTFALSICGPIALFASMSLMELLFSGDPRYRNLREVALAQLVCYLALAGLAGLVIALCDRSYLLVFAIVAIGRGADLMSALALHVMRARGWFRRIALIGVLQFSLFLLLVGLGLLANVATPVVEVATAMTVTAIVQAGVALYALRDALRCDDGEEPIRPFAFIRRHLFRSIAISLNSLQGNVPRYSLELLASPQHQAAFSLMNMIVRAGTIVFQSLFVAIVGLFKVSHAVRPRRAVLLAAGSFFAASIAFTAAVVGVWLAAVHLGLIQRFAAEIALLLPAGTGTLVLIGSGVYLLRFGVWQLVSLLDSGVRQTSYALVGLAVTAIGVVSLTPAYGIAGAAIAELIGNLLLLLLPLAVWWRRAGPGSPSRT